MSETHCQLQKYKRSLREQSTQRPNQTVSFVHSHIKLYLPSILREYFDIFGDKIIIINLQNITNVK